MFKYINKKTLDNRLIIKCLYFIFVGVVGFEPTTPAMSRQCSNQLSYTPFSKSLIQSAKIQLFFSFQNKNKNNLIIFCIYERFLL